MRKCVIIFLLSLSLLNYFEPTLRSLVEPNCLTNNMTPWFCNPELFWSVVRGVRLISWFCLIVCPVLLFYHLIKRK